MSDITVEDIREHAAWDRALAQARKEGYDEGYAQGAADAREDLADLIGKSGR